MLAQPRNNQPPSRPVGSQNTPPGTFSRPVGPQGTSYGGNSRPVGTNSHPPAGTSRPVGTNSHPPAGYTRPPGNNTRPPGTPSRPQGNATLPPTKSTRPRTVTSASMEVIRAINPRRLMGAWLIAIVAAGALIFLFPRTLQETPRGATSTTAPTASPTVTIESADQAWGAQATALYPLTGTAAAFTPTDVDPAGKFAVGYETLNGSGGTNIAMLDLSTPNATTAPTPQTICQAQQGVTPAPIILTDGTYVAWIATQANNGAAIYATTPQAPTCTAVGMTTGKAGAPKILALDGGHLVWQTANNPQSVQVLNLATPGALPVTMALKATLATKLPSVIQLAWPHLLYQATNGAIHVVTLSDTASPVDATYANVKPGPSPQVQVTTQGITWVASGSGATALRIEHVSFSPSAKPTTIVTLPTSASVAHLAAAMSVIAWDDGTNFLAWDAGRHLFVKLHAAPTTNAILAAHTMQLWYLTDDATTPSLAVIDTTTLGK